MQRQGIDPKRTKIIDVFGVEREHPLDLIPEEGFPRVLVKNCIRAPSLVYVADDGEIAKRGWNEMVYREAPALFI